MLKNGLLVKTDFKFESNVWEICIHIRLLSEGIYSLKWPSDNVTKIGTLNWLHVPLLSLQINPVKESLIIGQP